MVEPTAYLFVDLDDSLLQTRPKCLCEPLIEAAYDRAGAALSFHTPQQSALLALLKDAVLIPVTGRNLDALRRVCSPKFSSYRITSHGALVLGKDERLLPDWEARMSEALPYWASRLADATSLVNDRIATQGLGARVRLIYDLGFPVYVSVKGDSREMEHLATEMAAHWSEGVIHHNEHNLALLPPIADKAAAVRHVMREIQRETAATPLFIGLGDSLTDLPFLRLCHFALVPQHSQIQARTWR